MIGGKQINRESPLSDCSDSTEKLEMLSREAGGDWGGDMSSVDSTDILLAVDFIDTLWSDANTEERLADISLGSFSCICIIRKHNT